MPPTNGPSGRMLASESIRFQQKKRDHVGASATVKTLVGDYQKPQHRSVECEASLIPVLIQLLGFLSQPITESKDTIKIHFPLATMSFFANHLIQMQAEVFLPHCDNVKMLYNSF